MKCDEYTTRAIKGKSVRRRCRRDAMDGSTKCYRHGGAEAYEGDPRLGPGMYYKLGTILGSPKSGTHVMRVLKGETQPSWAFAQKLATAAGVTLDELAKHVRASGSELAKELREINKRRKAAA